MQNDELFRQTDGPSDEVAGAKEGNSSEGNADLQRIDAKLYRSDFLEFTTLRLTQGCGRKLRVLCIDEI